MIICKKCKKAVSYNSYFQKYICNNCGWECIENDTKTDIEEAKECLEEIMQNTYAEGKAIKLNNLLKYVNKLENKVKELEKENTDIKEVYIRTAKHLDKKGMLELSEYLLAQIEATPTFTTWEEYTTWVSKQAIRDKIELYKRLEIESFNKDSIQADEYRAIIKVLQELLEEK